MCRDAAVPSVEDMTSYPPTQAPTRPPSAPGGATSGMLWILRIFAGIQAFMLVAQPVLAGRFLDGDYPSLSTHGNVGIALMLVACFVVVAAVLAWRPGRLPAWPIAIAFLSAMLLPIQLGMGHARFLAIHLALGVALVAAGVIVAAWAWRPGRARRSYRAPSSVMVDGGTSIR